MTVLSLAAFACNVHDGMYVVNSVRFNAWCEVTLATYNAPVMKVNGKKRSKLDTLEAQ